MEKELPNQELPNQEPVKKMTVGDLLKNRRNVLIAVAFLVLVLLLTFSFFAARMHRVGNNPTSSTTDLTTPQATIYFVPSIINATPGKPTTVDVYIDTWGMAISGINVAVSYNPNVVKDVKLIQFKDTTSAVSSAFESTSMLGDNAYGIVQLPLSMATTTPMQKGSGKVATLTFTPVNTNVTQTRFSFSPSTAFITKTAQKTIVLQEGNLIVNYPVDGVFPTLPPVSK